MHVLTATEPQTSSDVTFKAGTNIKPFQTRLTKYLLGQKCGLEDQIIMSLSVKQLTRSPVLRDVRHIIRCLLWDRRRPSTERKRK